MDPKYVLEFRVTIMDYFPPIWRRIRVPYDFTFYDLHRAVQRAMGWSDVQHHQFHVRFPNEKQEFFVRTHFDSQRQSIVCDGGYKCLLRDILLRPKVKTVYTYDYADAWEHEILLERILLEEEGVKYPICVDGERTCPLENIGGVVIYRAVLNILNNPAHPEHGIWKMRLKRYYNKDEFDPEAFDKTLISFD